MLACPHFGPNCLLVLKTYGAIPSRKYFIKPPARNKAIMFISWRRSATGEVSNCVLIFSHIFPFLELYKWIFFGLGVQETVQRVVFTLCKKLIWVHPLVSKKEISIALWTHLVSKAADFKSLEIIKSAVF